MALFEGINFNRAIFEKTKRNIFVQHIDLIQQKV